MYLPNLFFTNVKYFFEFNFINLILYRYLYTTLMRIVVYIVAGYIIDLYPSRIYYYSYSFKFSFTEYFFLKIDNHKLTNVCVSIQVTDTENIF